METKISKKKVSSYQKLKAKKEELEFLIEMILTRPTSQSTKDMKRLYKIENDLL